MSLQNNQIFDVGTRNCEACLRYGMSENTDLLTCSISKAATMSAVRAFYTLIVTQIISLIGSRMTGVALGIQIFSDTGDTAPLLIAAFFGELPGMLGNSISGWVADRLDRKQVIILGDVGQAAATGFLLLMFLTGSFQLWHLYLMMFAQGVFSTVQGAASQAAITMLVPENQRDRANGIRGVGFPLAGIVAPVLAGILYSVVGVVGVIVVDLITFLIAILVIARISIPRPAQSAEAQESGGVWWREISGGWRFLWRRPVLLGLIVYVSFVWFLINGPLELVTPYIIALTGSEALLGVLLGALNLGAFVGAAFVAAVGSMRQRVRLIMLSFLLHGALLIVYGTVREPWQLGVVGIILMFPLPVIGALMATILQNKTPPDLQGRVFGINDQLGMLLTPFSFLMTAWVVDNMLEPAVGQPEWAAFAPLVGSVPGSGMGLVMVIIGAIIIVTALLVYPFVRHLERDLPDYEVVIEPTNQSGFTTEQS
jgi:MFS family permease